jgi:hypothetical protein
VERDERTTVVEHASYRLAYLFLSYALLLDVAYRSFARNESPWDLLALVVLGGAVSTAYQARHQILGRRWVVVTLATVLAAGAIAAVLATIR